MELRHYADRPVALHRDLLYPQRIRDKPVGLWVSVPGEDDWPTWVTTEQWDHPRRVAHGHRVVLRPCANLRVVSDVGQFDEFHLRYGAPKHWRHEGDDHRYWDIDWPRVASEYDGVVIAPYLYARRMDPHWYYTWDCASGCIWNLCAIEGVVPLP